MTFEEFEKKMSIFNQAAAESDMEITSITINEIDCVEIKKTALVKFYAGLDISKHPTFGDYIFGIQIMTSPKLARGEIELKTRERI